MTTLSIIRPDDWHVHLRDGAALKIPLQIPVNILVAPLLCQT